MGHIPGTRESQTDGDMSPRPRSKTVRAIQTWYAGHRFRSRREARWAIFFDTLGVPWEYEPQGYVLEGIAYLPDFQVYPNDNPFWFEVKGVSATTTELHLLRLLTEATAMPAFLCDQPLPHRSDQIPTLQRPTRTKTVWTDCPACGRVLPKSNGWAGWCPTDDARSEPLSLVQASWTGRLQNAYAAGLSARFEHGESR